MNPSGPFSFVESSVWDPKLIMKRLIVPQDQMAKLNSLPGWLKSEDNEDNLRLDKDFSLQSSQADCPINGTQNSQRIQKNIVLFNEEVENRKAVLKSYKVLQKKLTRSLSLFAINENCENLLNTPKRTLSLQSLNQEPYASKINIHFTDFSGDNFSEKPMPHSFCNKNTLLDRSVQNTKLSQCESPHSGKSKELFLNEEINSMDGASHSPMSLPVNIPVEKADLCFATAKRSESTLPIENSTTKLVKEAIESDNSEVIHKPPVVLFVESIKAGLSNQVIKSVNADLFCRAVKELNSLMPNVDVAHSSNDMSDELQKAVLNSRQSYAPDSSNIKVPTDVIPVAVRESAPCVVNVSANFSKSLANENKLSDIKTLDGIGSSMNKFTQSNVPVSSETSKSKIITAEENPEKMNTVSTHANSAFHINVREEVISSNMNNSNETILKGCIGSDMNSVEGSASKDVSVPPISESADLNLYGLLCPSKSQDKGLSVSKKETEQLVGNSVSVVRINDSESEQKNSDDKNCDPTKSTAENEASNSKKRKMESRNRRSKRLKSEEKQGNLKIRSIKKVGEICYSVEEVKTMLDIMKQFL